MLAVRCTKKLLDRVKPPIILPSGASEVALGNWYATALFWKPQLALFVHEETLLPVLVPLAPASTLVKRFPASLAKMLSALGIDAGFIATQIAAMDEVQYAKTSNRSVLGIMNQFSYLAEDFHEHLARPDLLVLSLKLAHIPCGPLYKREVFPDWQMHRWIREHGG